MKNLALQEKSDIGKVHRARALQLDAGELVRLAQHEDPVIRQRVAEDPAAPKILLHFLSRDSNEQVRLSAAENPRISYASLRGMLHDASADVRYALAENHNLPLSFIAQLTRDENPYVANRAQRTLNRCVNRDAVSVLLPEKRSSNDSVSANRRNRSDDCPN